MEHPRKSKLAFIALTILIQGLSVGQVVPADSTELLRLEHVWNEAHLKGDVVALNRLWANDLVVTVPKMPAMNKEESLAIWQSGRMKFQSYQTSDIRVRIFDDAAVVTGRVERIRDRNGQEVKDDWRFTKVYVRRADRWQVVAWHASESAAQ